MELDKLGAVLRARSTWEAIDLGFAMGRTWRRPIYRAWIATVLPAYALVWALLLDHPVIALLVVWWLKPLWDQGPLYVVSRTMFGEVPTLRQLLRELPRLWGRQLLLGLVLYRFDWARSFFQPVLQLERPQGHARGRRRRALMRSMGAASAWLTFVCICLELVLVLGLFGLAFSFLPSAPEYEVGVLAGAWWDGTAPLWAKLIVPLVAFLALSGVEPLYVTAGFALYINRRTLLEGWDVELVFRRLAERLRRKGISAWRAGAAAALLLAVGAAALAPRGARAEEPPPTAEVSPQPSGSTAPRGEVEAAVRTVLSREEFGSQEHRRVWRRRHPREVREGRDTPLLDGLGSCVAMGIEPVMWGLFAVVLVALVVFVLSKVRRGEGRAAKPARPAIPAARIGLSIPPPEALPADVPGAAADLWRHGLKAQALGLLYRGAVSHLVAERGFPIEDGATEGECLRVVRSKGAEALAGFFATLTRTWQTTAYAHREPEEGAFRELCSGWPAHFGGGA